MTGDDRLRLLALDEEDLAVISAHVQDAVLQVGDLAWLAREGRFVMPMNRFAWEAVPSGWFRRKDYQRRRAVLHFDRVTSVKYSGFDNHARDRVLAILAIRFQPGEAPSGQIEILFSGDASLRLAVECIEARIGDLGPSWSTAHAPRHQAAPD
jgi:hypothetical protein